MKKTRLSPAEHKLVSEQLHIAAESIRAQARKMKKTSLSPAEHKLVSEQLHIAAESIRAQARNAMTSSSSSANPSAWINRSLALAAVAERITAVAAIFDRADSVTLGEDEEEAESR